MSYENKFRLEALTLQDVQQVARWRNKVLETLRTPFMLNSKMQEDFYHKIICDRNASSRFWAIYLDELMPNDNDEIKIGATDIFIAMIGIINIEWENSLGEISIIINPNYRNLGYGSKCVHMLLNEGFMNMNLENIFGETYLINSSSVSFWEKIILKYDAEFVVLPHRKYWEGEYYPSKYFNINKEGYMKTLFLTNQVNEK